MSSLSSPHAKPNVDHLVDMLRADFRARQAPPELIAAFTPLLDDDVADTAWRVLYRCGTSL